MDPVTNAAHPTRYPLPHLPTEIYFHITSFLPFEAWFSFKFTSFTAYQLLQHKSLAIKELEVTAQRLCDIVRKNRRFNINFENDSVEFDFFTNKNGIFKKEYLDTSILQNRYDKYVETVRYYFKISINVLKFDEGVVAILTDKLVQKEKLKLLARRWDAVPAKQNLRIDFISLLFFRYFRKICSSIESYLNRNEELEDEVANNFIQIIKNTTDFPTTLLITQPKEKDDDIDII